MMIESFLTFAKDNYHFLIPGVFVTLTALILIFKLALPKSPKEALTILVGTDHLYFKAKSFQEKSFWENSVPKMCEDIKIELYKVKDDKLFFYTLSERNTCIMAPVELEEPVQIRFKYRDGLFWTAWSKKIKKVIRRPPFQLQVYTENLQNQHQQLETEEGFYNNFCQEFRQRISNARNVNIRLMGRAGTGKSSLINTFFSAFTTTWRDFAPTYGQNIHVCVCGHVTQHELVPDQVRLVDMPRWQNYAQFHIMGDFVRGAYDDMPPEMQQNDQKRRGNQAPELNEEPREEERNAIILVIAAEDARGDDVNRRVVQEIIELGYPCLVLVTKVDRLAEAGEELINPDNFYTDPRVIDCCNQLRSLGVNEIIPMINYTHQAPQNCKINYVALHALDEAIRLAR